MAKRRLTQLQEDLYELVKRSVELSQELKLCDAYISMKASEIQKELDKGE